MRGPLTRHQTALRTAALLLGACACTALDAGRAQRCFQHSDCNPGRICVDERCRPLTDTEAGPELPVDSTSDPPAPARSESATQRPRLQPIATGADDTDATTRLTPDAGAVTALEAGIADAARSPQMDLDDDAGPRESDPTPQFPDARTHPCAQEVLLWEQAVLWLAARAGTVTDDQGAVHLWADGSHYHHRAEPVGAEPALWPRRVLIPGERSAVAIEFALTRTGPHAGTGRRLRIADHPSLRFGFADFAIIAVVRYRNSIAEAAVPNEIGALFLKQCSMCLGLQGPALWANDNWAPQIDGSPTRSAAVFQLAYGKDYIARSSVTDLNDNRVHVIVGKRLGETLSVEVDAAARDAVALGVFDVSARDVDVTIGANQIGDLQALDGDLFELIVLTGESANSASGLIECLLDEYRVH